MLDNEGAESVDAALSNGGSDCVIQKKTRYPQTTRSFSEDEKFFRLGFQAAMNAKTRCLEFDQISAEMNAALEDVQKQYPDAKVEEPFTRGYQRGREHYQELCNETKRAA